MEKYGYLPKKPKFKAYFNWVPMGEDIVQVRSLENIFTMKGKSVVELLPKLIPLLDGTNTMEDLIEKLPDIDSEVVKGAVIKLTQHFLLEDADVKSKYELSEEEIEAAYKQIEFFSHFSDRQLPSGEVVNKYQILKTLKTSKCLVIGLGNLGIHIINSLAVSNVGELFGYDYGNVNVNDIGMFYKKEDLGIPKTQIASRIVGSVNKFVKYEGCNLSNSEDQELERLINTVDFVILSTDIPLKSIYDKVNKLCLRYEKPWISARINEIEMEIGPLVIPHQTPCFECYTTRVNGNLSFFDENVAFESFKENNLDKIQSISIEPIYSIISNMLTMEVIKVLTSILYPICISRVLTYNIITMDTKTSSILKIPRCKSCGILVKAPSTAPYAVFLP